MLETYRPSGRISPVYGIAFLAAALAALSVGWVYQFLVWWIPFIYIVWLLTLGAALALGVTTYFAVRLGKCRNAPVALIVGALLGVLVVGGTHYFSYVNHRDYAVGELLGVAQAENKQTLGDVGITESGLDPATPLSREVLTSLYGFGSHLEERTENGWRVGKRTAGIPVTGVFVYLIWLIEAGVLVLGTAVGGWMMAKTPFDENAGDWMKQTELFAVSTSREHSHRLANANSVQEIFTLPARSKLSELIVRYKLATSAGAGEPSYLTIEEETVEKDKDGNDQKKTRDLKSWVKLEPTQTAQLLKLVNGASAPQRTATAAEALGRRR